MPEDTRLTEAGYPEHYYEEYLIPEGEKFIPFRYGCRSRNIKNRNKDLIREETVWCKDLKTFRRLISRWNASEKNYEYYSILDEEN